MKRIIITLILSVWIIFGINFLLKILFKGVLNPKTIQLDKQIINLPKNMYLQEVFFTNSMEGKSQDTIDLILSEDPYPIKYPKKYMQMLIIGGHDNNLESIILMPSLNKNNLETFSKIKSRFKNCIIVKDGKKNYILNSTTNKGYVIRSHTDELTNILEREICQLSYPTVPNHNPSKK